MVGPRLSFAVGPRTGTDPTQPVTAFSSGSFKLNLRTGPEMSTSVPGRSPAALQTSGLSTDLWLYRSGTLFQRMRILPVDQSWGADGSTDAVITAVGYQRLIEARHVIALAPVANGVPLFYQVDQGTILWNLVQHTQAQNGGNLGITSGTVVTGVKRDRTEYKIGDNLGTLMTALGDIANGVWWGIDSAKVMTAKLFSAFPLRTDPVVLGTNARTMQRARGRTFANAAGASGSQTLTVPEWRETAGIAIDVRGRWETFDSSHSDVELQATVGQYADGALAAAQVPPSVWTIELDPAQYFEGSSNYAVGEFAQVVIPPNAVDEIDVPAVSAVVQITELSFSFDDSGAIQVMMAAVEVV